MTGRIIMALSLVLAPAATQVEGRGLRLTPAEIMALPSIEAGAGTSGVSGIRTRVLSGNPTSIGPYTIALTVPAHTLISAQRHRDARVVTVISGTWEFGYGTGESQIGKALGPGSFYTEPADLAHFARTGSEPVTLYINGFGPTDTVYEKVSADAQSY